MQDSCLSLSACKHKLIIVYLTLFMTGERAPESFIYNFKSVHGTATKITQNNILIIFNS